MSNVNNVNSANNDNNVNNGNNINHINRVNTLNQVCQVNSVKSDNSLINNINYANTPKAVERPSPPPGAFFLNNFKTIQITNCFQIHFKCISSFLDALASHRPILESLSVSEQSWIAG